MEINNNTCVFPMTIDQFYQILDNDNHPYEDLIVTIKYKYDWETEYLTENQFLEYDGNSNDYVWLHDWDEGQTDVTVLGCIPVSEVSTISERPETHLPTRNIDYIRSLSVDELANLIHYWIYCCEEGDCSKCPLFAMAHACTVEGVKEWLLSERSEKEDSNE